VDTLGNHCLNLTSSTCSSPSSLSRFSTPSLNPERIMPRSTQPEAEQPETDLTELQPLDNPIVCYENPKDTVTYVPFFVTTFLSESDIGIDPVMQERRKLALQYAAEGLQLPGLIECRRASRRVQHIFEKILREVTDMATNPKQTTTKNQRGEDIRVYAPSQKRFEGISVALGRVGKLANPGFAMKGQAYPMSPLWLAGDTGTSFFTANDYEILMVGYRAQVEEYLVQLDEVYDFQARGVRISAEIDAKANSLLPNFSHNAKGSVAGGDSISSYLRAARKHAHQTSAHMMNSNSRLGELLGSNGQRRDVPPHMASRSRRSAVSPVRDRAGQPSDSDPSSSSDSDSDADIRSRGRHRVGRENQGGRGRKDKDRREKKVSFQFDLKLKFDNVPQWDGNTETIVKWISKVNDLADYSPAVRKQLGSIVPKRLQDKAETWYFSLPLIKRKELERKWDYLREEIIGYFMNRKWLERMKKKARNAYYRETGHAKETPSEYYIRKYDLLTCAYELDDSEIITEIMEGAPELWNSILTTQAYEDACDFQKAIRYHEDTLLKLEKILPEAQVTNSNRQASSSERNTSRSYLVRSRSDLPPPPFPKDDSVVSRKATPKDKGARPCRHCGSELHWDNECKHSRRRTARTQLADSSKGDLEAQDQYDDLYYSLGDENESDFQ
jgi:hypothetical protein